MYEVCADSSELHMQPPLKLCDGHLITRYSSVNILDPVAFHSVLTCLVVG